MSTSARTLLMGKASSVSAEKEILAVQQRPLSLQRRLLSLQQQLKILLNLQRNHRRTLQRQPHGQQLRAPHLHALVSQRAKMDTNASKAPVLTSMSVRLEPTTVTASKTASTCQENSDAIPIKISWITTAKRLATVHSGRGEKQPNTS